MKELIARDLAPGYKTAGPQRKQRNRRAAGPQGRRAAGPQGRRNPHKIR